ncbi:MAG TPA: PASTA domain-containing protein [Actinomycetes bacterium]|nr:PASTA domain-containing protein [Actinomycetes bacterium]
MKEGIGLLAAILGLTTAVIVLLAALNKTDTVEVPVIREIQVLQPSTTTQATTTEPVTETVSVPPVVGLSQEDAEEAIEVARLVVERVDTRETEQCQEEGHASGTMVVVETSPPVGTELSEGEGVTLTVCE